MEHLNKKLKLKEVVLPKNTVISIEIYDEASLEKYNPKSSLLFPSPAEIRVYTYEYGTGKIIY